MFETEKGTRLRRRLCQLMLFSPLAGVAACTKIRKPDELPGGHKSPGTLDKSSELLSRKEWLRGISVSLSSPELRILMPHLREQCRGTCTQQELHDEFCLLHKSRKELFWNVMGEQERVQLEMRTPRTGEPAGNGFLLTSEAAEDLERFVKFGMILPTTQFVIIARPVESEDDKENRASQRGEVVMTAVRKLLAKYGYPPTAELDTERLEQRLWLWIYAFPLPSSPKRSTAQVMQRKPLTKAAAASTSDAVASSERAVWVFRVDC